MKELRIADRYRALRELARGGMAVVHEAIDEADGSRVAIKVVRRASDRVDRFEREVAATSRITHPHVCPVLGAGVLPDGRPYLVMPLLQGEPLRALISREAPLTQAVALSITDQILSALEAAHEAGVLHRDLKPDNVFVLEGGPPVCVQVLDFGVARLLDTDGPGVRTATGTAVGTAAYMAPEQARGQRDQDQRVDVWATGVLLYEMLTGAKPFGGASFAETAARVLFDPFAPPRVLRPDLAPAVEQLVLGALQRDREKRFSSARAMREALLAAPIDSMAPSLPRSTMPPEPGRGDGQ